MVLPMDETNGSLQSVNDNDNGTESENFLVVGIGASAGGIRALQQFFEKVPEKSECAYVVILHLSPDHDSKLAEVLRFVSNIPVFQVNEKTKVQPNHIYVIPPHKHLHMIDGFIAVSENISVEERRAPVDIFFRTLGDCMGPRAVSVVLSGTGANGSMGLKRVKERGGAAYVQNPREAEFNEMPRNAIETDLVDEILPVADIPKQIINYARGQTVKKIVAEPEVRPEEQEKTLRELFLQLRARTGHDFTNYRRPTLLRRIERRINLRNLPDLPTYADFFTQNPEETVGLLKDLLISVTNFFRDAKPFQAIENDLLPKILRGKNAEDEIRIWVAGCATGEEAYSLAILCAEKTLGVLDAPKIQIFATDIDEAAINTAREGFYTINDAADVSPERLRRFFEKQVDGYRVRREIREMILFANHNFIKDPPFSRLDLVSCRNVLIYLNNVAQQRTMETFHFALRPESYLFLGSSESAEGTSELFSVYSRENHIFQARKVSARNYRFPESLPNIKLDAADLLRKSDHQEGRSPDRITYAVLHQRILEEYAPPSVVLTESYDILHMSETVGKYLQISGGEITQNILKLVRPEVRTELRSALYKAVNMQTAVETRDIKVMVGSQSKSINVHVRPVLGTTGTTKGLILVIFQEKAVSEESTAAALAVNEPIAIQLEEELGHVQNELQRSAEQHEIQAEELKASNEELQAMNEELETSREELQSINEELRTVNQELKIKVEESAHTTNNIQNLIRSADVGTIFLDRSFRVRLFTPSVRDIFNLIDTDFGRPVTDITHRLNYTGFLEDAETVLEKLITVEREVNSSDGRAFMMRLLPYRTSQDHIDGVVITFFDITKRRLVEEALRQSESHLRLLIESATDYAIFTLDSERRVVSWNKGAETMTDYSENEIIGKSGDIIFTEEDRAAGVPAKETEQADREGRAQNERWHVRKDGTRFWGSGSVSSLRDQTGQFFGFVKIMRDLTEARKLEEEKFFLASIVESSQDPIFTMNFDNIITSWNKAAEDMYGLKQEEVLGKHVKWLKLPPDLVTVISNNQTIRDSGEVKVFDTIRVRKDDMELHVEVMRSPVKNAVGEAIGISAISTDITGRKHADEAIRRSEDRFRTLADAVPQLIWTNDDKGYANYFNQRWFEYSGLTLEQSMGRGWQAIVHPEDASASINKWNQALAEAITFDSEYRLRDAHGDYRWHIGRNVPLKDSSGNIVGWFGSATEIEGLKRAEESSRLLADRLQLALDAGRLGSFEYDFNSGVLTSTSQHKANHGYSEDENPTFDELKQRIVSDDQAFMEAVLGKAIKEHKIHDAEYRIRLTGKATRWIKSVGKILYDENDQPQKLVGISLDITAQKNFMEELSQQVDQRTLELQRSNEDLLQFAHVASHDLKEPVRKILTFNNRLMDEFGHLLPEKARTYLEKIGHATERMVSMIEGVLTYSSFKNENYAFEIVDLNTTLKQVESDLELLIHKKNGVINKPTLAEVKGIPILIYQLFYNLINNALKFSKVSEPVVIDITQEIEKRENVEFLKITVCDNGIGFEPEFEGKIFDIFTRLNGKDEYEGTGLGLALCKKIVERHGGHIYATSQVNQGATFTILFPYKRP